MHRPKRRYRDMTPEIARQMRDLYFIAGFKQPQIAEIYKKTQSTVSRVINEQVWAEK